VSHSSLLMQKVKKISESLREEEKLAWQTLVNRKVKRSEKNWVPSSDTGMHRQRRRERCEKGGVT